MANSGYTAVSTEWVKDARNACYFAKAVSDPAQYPAKDQAMQDIILERRTYEHMETTLRVANGGKAELTSEQMRAQMKDRMRHYLSSGAGYQKRFTM